MNRPKFLNVLSAEPAGVTLAERRGPNNVVIAGSWLTGIASPSDSLTQTPGLTAGPINFPSIFSEAQVTPDHHPPESWGSSRKGRAGRLMVLFRQIEKECNRIHLSVAQNTPNISS